ncbi:MAG TPA: helix-hairpin-helix domain-containing protein [Gemmatimonadaceae bacterium]|nr:helix-hairpin-helix domain-containing protein [Gemmatimonadaceae bacterium]
MPTPSEQKALAFIAMVVLLGGAVRVVRAGSSPVPTPLEQQALARQATAADSAAEASPSARKSRARARRSKRGSEPTVIGGVAGVPPATGPVPNPPLGPTGFPPPNPRIDVDYRGNRFNAGSQVRDAGGAIGGAAGPLVDLDRASEREIDALPRIGPAIARRIVASRDSLGAFGSLEGLGRVRGMGPATRKRLAPLVTFSGRPSSRP